MNQIMFYNIGDSVEDQIPPYESFYLQFQSYNSKHSHVGIYIDKNSPPTFTKFKFFETFDGNTLISKNTVDFFFHIFQMSFFLDYFYCSKLEIR